jgi:uncharacterized protein with von Willebrand factor type A (vWA) domain
VWVLPFDENVGTIMSADNKNDALTVMRWLGTVNYDGGGTDIQGAVLRAYQLLEKDKTYEKADIVLITDGCSPISDALTKLKPQRLKLRTMIIGDGNDYGEHSRRLKNASDSYAVIEWDNASNSFTVGDTLKGITPQST